MKKSGITLLIALIFIFSLTFTLALPIGITIETPIIETHKVNTSFSFHAYAHNTTSGLILKNDTTNCTLQLYQPNNGEQILIIPMTFNIESDLDYDIEITAGNFTEIGQYAIVIYCEIPGVIGGFIEYGFETTYTGLFLGLSEAILYFILAFGMFLLFLLSFYFMIMTPYGNETDGVTVIKITKLKYVKLGFILLTWIFLTWFLNILIGISQNFISLSLFSGFFGFIFTVMNSLALWVGLVVLVIAFWEIIRDANLSDSMKELGRALK